MAKTATFSNPVRNYNGSGGASAAVPVASGAIHASVGEISDCTLRIETDVASLYSLDTSADNPCQLHSQVLVMEGAAYWFRGVVTEKPYYAESDADGTVKTYLVVECQGNEYALANAAVTDAAGNERWSVATSTIQVGAAAPYLPLKASSSYGSFGADTDTLWPDPGDAEGATCYIQDADCASDTIAADIASGTPAPFHVELTTTNQGFAPQGWLKINSEWFYYEGYDPTGSGDKYRVYVQARAELGTVAADHTAGDTAYNKVCKRLGPEPPIVYEDTAGGTAFTAMEYNDRYSPHFSYGCFVMGGGITAGATYAATCYYYDDDGTLGGATLYAVEDIIELIVTTPLEYGGSGFSSGTISFDTTGINVTRYDYDPDRSGATQWEAINKLLEGLNLTDEYAIWYDHTAGKLRFGAIANGSVDLTLTGVESVEVESAIHDAYSAIRVRYSNDQDPNLASANYSWHAAEGAAGAVPDTWYACSAGAEGWEYGTYTNPSGAGSDGVEFTIDGRLDTKLLAEVFHDPAADFPHTHYWFGAGAPTITLDEVDVRVNGYRSTENRTRTNTDNSYIVKVEGCADYNSSTHVGTWQNLGTKLKGTATGAIGRTAKTKQLNLTDFALPQVNAIRVTWEYMAGPVDDGHKYWAAIHAIKVRGNIVKYALIQTTANDLLKTFPVYLYAPSSHVKLRGGVNASGSAGAQRVMFRDIGAASEAAAITIGRAYLSNSLKLYQARRYSYPGVLSTKPEIADTVATDEGGGGADYTGVLREYSVSFNGAGTKLDYTVIDYNASDIS